LLPLRYPWLWMIPGWALVLAVATGTLVPGPMLKSVAFNDKLEHASAYFVLMLWFGGLYSRKRLPLVAIALFSLGFALDLLQLTTRTRTFDLRDVAANGCGILAGLVLAVALLGGWCQRVERLWWAPRA
jgi:VanZ family protein